jgi:hypothetical protein
MARLTCALIQIKISLESDQHPRHGQADGEAHPSLRQHPDAYESPVLLWLKGNTLVNCEWPSALN